MNKNILQKILTELGKDTPSIDYLKGMVETLLEMGDTLPIVGTGSYPYVPPSSYVTQTTPARTEFVSDESTEVVPAFLRAGTIGKITNN